jgi:hypothetical protein
VRLKTSAFNLLRGKLNNLFQLAGAMRVSVSQVYWIQEESHPINQKFIVGAVRAFGR